jgi:hypothetical protein
MDLRYCTPVGHRGRELSARLKSLGSHIMLKLKLDIGVEGTIRCNWGELTGPFTSFYL